MDDNNIIIYQTEDGNTKIETRLEGDTVWLTQAQLAELFKKAKSTISEHVKNIFEEAELDENSVVRNFRTTAADGKHYNTTFYNLDVIISVGYRVKSHQGTKFRQWATARILAKNKQSALIKKALLFCHIVSFKAGPFLCL